MTLKIGPHLLGRKVEHDPRSRNFPFPQRTVTRLVNVTHRTIAPILNQGDVGSCEGHTAANWLNCDIAVKNRRRTSVRPFKSDRLLNDADAVKLYSKATEMDEDGTDTVYPPDDTGTSALGIARSMQFYNAIDSYQWTFSWQHFLAAIQSQPVMLGTNWYEGMFYPDTRGHVEISGPLYGGHAYLARGVDHTRQRVLCRNQWGSRWGIRGEFYLRFSTLQRLLNEQGDVLVPAVLK